MPGSGGIPGIPGIPLGMGMGIPNGGGGPPAKKVVLGKKLISEHICGNIYLLEIQMLEEGMVEHRGSGQALDSKKTVPQQHMKK